MLKMKKYILVFVVILALMVANANANANAMFISPQPLTEQQLADIKEKAAHGDINAEMQLAFNYYIPDTYRPKVLTGKDNKQAFKYFRQAAETGDALSQTYVGLFYDRGKEVDRDYKAALKWYQMAAAQGYPYAQDLIGRMYRDGHGVSQDYSLAADFFKKAALQYTSSNTHLARLYFTGGPEFPQDYEKAFFWLNLPANPAWPDERVLAPADDLCCEHEDFTHSYYREVEKRLTPAQIEKVKKQVKDYKMPSPTKWSPLDIRMSQRERFTPPSNLRQFISPSFNQLPSQPNGLKR